MPETNSLLAAVRWIEGLLLGSVAVAVATIAFAGIGFLMLSGRIDMRTGARVVLGCFVLFGARTIASGLQNASAGAGASAYAAAPPVAAIPTESRPGAPINNDPFAGASVPMGSGTCCD